MNSFENQLATHYYNGKSHISIYPVIVVSASVNGVPVNVPYKVNLKSAFTESSGKNWRWQQIFDGVDEGCPLQNWEDVIWLAEKELSRLSSIIEPLLYDDIQTAWNAWAFVNKRESFLTLKLRNDSQKKDYLFGSDDKLKIMEMENPEDDPRMQLGHWLPIWGAWKHFLEVFKVDLKNGTYVKL